MEQFRFPRSRKARIRRKWQMRGENWREVSSVRDKKKLDKIKFYSFRPREFQVISLGDFIPGDEFIRQPIRIGPVPFITSEVSQRVVDERMRAIYGTGRTSLAERMQFAMQPADQIASLLSEEEDFGYEMPSFLERISRDMESNIFGSAHGTTAPDAFPNITVEDVLRALQGSL